MVDIPDDDREVLTTIASDAQIAEPTLLRLLVGQPPGLATEPDRSYWENIIQDLVDQGLLLSSLGGFGRSSVPDPEIVYYQLADAGREALGELTDEDTTDG